MNLGLRHVRRGLPLERSRALALSETMFSFFPVDIPRTWILAAYT